MAEEIHKRLLKQPWNGNDQKKHIFVCLSHSLSVLLVMAFFQTLIELKHNKIQKTVSSSGQSLPQLLFVIYCLICMSSLLCYRFQALHTFQRAHWYFRCQQSCYCGTDAFVLIVNCLSSLHCNRWLLSVLLCSPSSHVSDCQIDGHAKRGREPRLWWSRGTQVNTRTHTHSSANIWITKIFPCVQYITIVETMQRSFF